MKSLFEITSLVLLDCGTMCGVDTTRDLKTISSRVEEEGDEFITITLPSLSGALERALDDGVWSSSLTLAFRGRRGRRLPLFLGGFFDQIFDVKGDVRPTTLDVVRAIRAVRQICKCCSKLYDEASKKRLVKAVQRYRSVENEVRHHVVPHDLLDTFRMVSAIVWGDLVNGSPSDYYDELRPKHGRGGTVEGIRGNDKYRFLSWPLRLEAEFPVSEFGVSSILNDDAQELCTTIDYPLPRDEPPVKVVLVPKTAKTPRVIGIEPVAMQYMQQGVLGWLAGRIETQSAYTRGHVNFSDQGVNNQLARISSKSGLLATIDLSDASDRVSCKLVAAMLESVPNFRRSVFACRSTRALLPDGVVIPLRKFASMGSATCFPIEAMVFYIAIVSSRIMRSGRCPTPLLVRQASREVYVYGDDLLFPSRQALSVTADLEHFGLKVNRAKSFWTGKFRESCGGDYYDGYTVTPVYFRRKCASHRADVKGLVSNVAFANQCFGAGLWRTLWEVRSRVEKILGPLPLVEPSDQVLGWVGFSNSDSIYRWDHAIQRRKSLGWVVTPKKSPSPLNGDGALLKCLRLVGQTTDPRHLLTSVRNGSLTLKRRWT